MVKCESCGGEIDVGVSECPYCGHSVIQQSTQRIQGVSGDEGIYGVQRDEEGLSHITFGDGQSGARPQSGDSVSSHYRQGSGSQGNIPSKQIEENIDRIARELERVPDPSKQKDSKDVGIIMIESMASVGNLLSEYQSSISQEAHLSTKDRDRISKKEARIQSKLEAMVAFCERADSKTQKKMGLSDSDIHRIRTTATKALEITTLQSSKCSRCGAVNRQGAKHCQNCGAPL